MIQHLVAIDLGTGGPKAALVSEGSITVQELPTNLLLLPGGEAEQDPDA